MTTKSNHTPEPWTISGDSIISGEKCIAVIETDGGYEAPPEQREANKQLIASVPDLLRQRDELLAALKSLLVIVDQLNRDTYDQTKLPPGSSSEWKEQVDARQAIARADGEPL